MPVADEEFDELCFAYGIELDDVTSEGLMKRKELGLDTDAPLDASDEDIIYKIDIPANRYDMLCVEGVARALNVFRQKIPPPTFTLSGPPREKLIVRPETALVRPFIVASVLRGVTLDADRYASLIDLQDKLHQNLCRHRSLVAIGTHDLSTVTGPFEYQARPPESIHFVPLKKDVSFDARSLLDYYDEHDLKLKKYTGLIKQSAVYPVVVDAQGHVLSLPPVINGARSAITLQTRDILVECTATDLHKAHVVLNTVVTMFAEYASTPFQVEPVEVVDAFGTSHVTPTLDDTRFVVSPDFVNKFIGMDLSPERQAELLTKMMLRATVREGLEGEGIPPRGEEPSSSSHHHHQQQQQQHASPSSSSGKMLEVWVPPTRSDILHPVDVAEDVAIAHGYNNIPWAVPPTVTVGRELPLNQITELLRGEMAMMGYTEILTWALCSKKEVFDDLRRTDDGQTAIVIGNPATAEFEVVRPTLLGSALKTLGANKDSTLPLQLFEISDVAYKSDAAATGARNERRLVAVVADQKAAFEGIHGCLNRVMEVLGVPCSVTGEAPSARTGSYGWEAVGTKGREEEGRANTTEQNGPFFGGRYAKIVYQGKDAAPGQKLVVGDFGVIHPEVLKRFDIDYPVTALEMNLEPFVYDQYGNNLVQHWE